MCKHYPGQLSPSKSLPPTIAKPLRADLILQEFLTLVHDPLGWHLMIAVIFLR
jgi:hypothetical protein